jgi:glyoxylase I family protein
MLNINKIHHIAIICADYPTSKKFYTETLGFKVEQEIFRSERNSYKLDLSVNGQYQIELFSFPNPPARPSRPESCGLRHLAFEVNDIVETHQLLSSNASIDCEAIRTDEFTDKKFFFISDPDGLPIEFYEK